MNIGILGAGQLGRMLALAGYPLGFEHAFYVTVDQPSTAGLGRYFRGRDGDYQLLGQFAAASDLITYEMEHMDLAMLEWLAAEKPVYPGPQALRICQDRALEKALFVEAGIPTAAYRIARSRQDLRDAERDLNLPLVAKTTRNGYDGRGQMVICTLEQLETAWDHFGGQDLLIERRIDFTRELSAIVVRGRNGEQRAYPVVENVHQDGILRYTLAPAPNLDPHVAKEAQSHALHLAEKLDYVGVLTLELFETQDGLIANEAASRVHNSGHWTIDGAHTSQFENHLRAIADLPLGDTAARGPSAMINIIGTHGPWEQVLQKPGCRLHLYGKSERPGRKLGHINLWAASTAELSEQLQSLAGFLSPETPLPNDQSAPRKKRLLVAAPIATMN